MVLPSDHLRSVQSHPGPFLRRLFPLLIVLCLLVVFFNFAWVDRIVQRTMQPRKQVELFGNLGVADNLTSSEMKSKTLSQLFALSKKNTTNASQKVSNFTTSPYPGCGILFVVGLTTPKIVVYEERWRSLGGRGPYQQELQRALISVRKNSPSLPVALASDVGKGNFSSEIIPLVDLFVSFNSKAVKQGWGDKIEGMKSSPFHRTIFLDTDVTVCGDLRHMCDMLDHYDIAMVLEPDLLSVLDPLRSAVVPPSELHHNTGMVAFKDTDSFRTLLKSWQSVHNLRGGSDQYWLWKSVLAGSSVRHLQLPLNYNLRAHGNIAPMYVRGPVFVIHSRSKSPTCAMVNRRTSGRIILPKLFGAILSSADNNTVLFP